MRRATDGGSPRTFFRSDRFFVVSNEWFFTTREGENQGPFGSQARAEEALQSYLRQCAGLPSSAWDVPGADR